jgi:hypothetical protein
MSLTTLYGVTYTVEMALSSATGSYGLWDTGLWNTATWGPDTVWTDVSQWVRSISTSRRFSRDLQAWDPGTATVVLDNRDARFSPSNTTGPYAVGGITSIRPWRPIRIRCSWAGTTYPVFAGYGIDLQDGWEQPFPGGGDAVLTIQCVDEWGSLARVDGTSGGLTVGAGETTGQRIHRILNNASHHGTRAIDNGVMTVMGTDLSQSTVSELQLTADSEGGALYIAGDGTVVFDEIYALIENTRSNTVQATFGDTPGTLVYNDIGVEYNGDKVINVVSFQRTGTGTSAIVRSDETSRALYGDKKHSRADLINETDTQVATLADLWLQRYKDPELRVNRLRVKPRADPSRLFPAVLGREMRDLIRVSRRIPGGITITQDVLVAGIAHTITGDNWVTEFTLWSSRPFSSFATDRWDTGRWDTAQWFY